MNIYQAIEVLKKGGLVKRKDSDKVYRLKILRWIDLTIPEQIEEEEFLFYMRYLHESDWVNVSEMQTKDIISEDWIEVRFDVFEEEKD